MKFKCHQQVFLNKALKRKIFNPLPHAGKFKCLKFIKPFQNQFHIAYRAFFTINALRQLVFRLFTSNNN